MVFTAGVGENSAELREQIVSSLGFMGIKIDPEKNKVRGEETDISAADAHCAHPAHPHQRGTGHRPRYQGNCRRYAEISLKTQFARPGKLPGRRFFIHETGKGRFSGFQVIAVLRLGTQPLLHDRAYQLLLHLSQPPVPVEKLLFLLGKVLLV